ncbi:MAG TPA: 23S rRNA (pseudouridine(1915)-N(3))-methyltransferase RlmH [Candidatus Thalassarchaeaceae archaeon]|nr:23S rRNA (pseudouridine(1915)-N(3))-methyltransferase RlmH [Candidatus Thalassarchaeaceae archaeon]|tara:strand:+ start:1865 stop:2299 length:435 start_codon:yes stop_codon:yes gene_type:complete
MGRVTIHLFGKPKSKAIQASISDYEERLKPRGISLEIHSTRGGTVGYEESLASMQGNLVILDEKGTQMSSMELAHWLDSATMDHANTNLVVGPPDGHGEMIRKSSISKISLSKMTLTHEMAAQLILEQLYRASEINRGSSYHRV